MGVNTAFIQAALLSRARVHTIVPARMEARIDMIKGNFKLEFLPVKDADKIAVALYVLYLFRKNMHVSPSLSAVLYIILFYPTGLTLLLLHEMLKTLQLQRWPQCFQLLMKYSRPLPRVLGWPPLWLVEWWAGFRDHFFYHKMMSLINVLPLFTVLQSASSEIIPVDLPSKITRHKAIKDFKKKMCAAFESFGIKACTVIESHNAAFIRDSPLYTVIGKHLLMVDVAPGKYYGLHQVTGWSNAYVAEK